jgi:hypothetical protein
MNAWAFSEASIGIRVRGDFLEYILLLIGGIFSAL